jgi:hypothetical protein
MTFPTIPLAMLPSDLQGSDNTARANIILNAFRIAVNSTLSVQNMVDGVVDEFEDETGVDTANSADETYDASGDYYHNPSGYTDDVFNVFSSHTSGAQTISTSHDQAPEWAWEVVSNDGTAMHWQGASSLPGWVVMGFGSGNAVEAMQYTMQARTSDIGRSPGTWTFSWSDNNSDWTTVHTLSGITWSAGQKRTYNGWSAPGAHRYWRIHITANPNSSYPSFAEWEIMELMTTANMVIVSEIAVAEAAPDEAFIVVWQEDVDAVTINTDLIAAVSRDDGTTWTNVTLVEEVTLSTGRILAGSVDISAQPSDTDMLWRLTVANNKEQKIHGVGLSWS